MSNHQKLSVDLYNLKSSCLIEIAFLENLKQEEKKLNDKVIDDNLNVGYVEFIAMITKLSTLKKQVVHVSRKIERQKDQIKSLQNLLKNSSE